MSKPIVLVTGATDGIGKQTALELARAGAGVIVHGRSAEKVAASAKSIVDETGSSTVSTAVADLSSLEAVRGLAKELGERVAAPTVLLHNAGVYEKSRHLTVDGFERTFAVNHLAPFLLTHLLLDRLAPHARIVLVASGVHRGARIDLADLQLEHDYDGYTAYAQSKLGNVLFANELAARLRHRELTVLSLHPGVIATKLLRAGFGGGGATLAVGAQTSVFAALDPSLEGKKGLYLDAAHISECSKTARDPELMRSVYEASCRLVGIDGLPLS